MKSLSQAILDEQIKNTVTPAVKVVVQEYGFPTCSDLMRFNKYDWEQVYSETANDLFHGLAFTSDGKMHRVKAAKGATYWEVYYQGVADPDTSSTYTSWTKIRTTAWASGGASPQVAIAACGTEISVITLEKNTSLYYAKSSDSGANWDAFALLMSINSPTGISIAYKTNGDLMVCVAREEQTVWYNPTYTITYFYWSSYIANKLRISDVWQAETETKVYQGDQGVSEDKISYIAVYHSGTYWYLIANIGEVLHCCYSTGAYWSGTKEIAVTSSDAQNINIMKLQPLSHDPLGALDIRRDPASTFACRDFWTAINYRVGTAAGDLLENVYICYVPSLDLVMFLLVTATQAFFMTPLEGTTFWDNIWARTTGVTTVAVNGLALAYNSNYLWATASDQIWRCPLPKEWTITAGSGAGDTLEIAVAKIIKIEESVDTGQASSLDITFDNSDDYFDSPGSGALSVLSRGSRINLYLGFKIGGVDTTSEYARYFVDNWEYNHEPNASRFVLHCLDAWDLLNKFTFPHYIEFNVATDEYSVYTIIGKLVEAIGGTLTYVNRSSYITSIYPRIEVRPNDTAGNLLRRLLILVPDQIRFLGNNATILYPQTTDTPIYYYAGPV